MVTAAKWCLGVQVIITHATQSTLHPIQPLKFPGQKENTMRNRRKEWGGRHLREDLSRDDLLFLLSMLEGELQAREEEITVLKAEKTDSALLEAHYGLRVPEDVLHALQRDSLQAQQDHLQDVYQNPTSKLNHLVEAQKESSRLMLEQLVEMARSHSDTLDRLEEQEKNRKAFIQKSNDLTTLLEQDRERLKLLLLKEREYQEIKEEKSKREVSTLHKELTKLKAFALLVVKEQQCMSELLEEQRQRVQKLTTITDHTKQALSAAYSRAKGEELKVLHLEVELQNQVSIFYQTQKTMTAKLADEDAQNQQLRQQLMALGHQVDKLEGRRSVLKNAEEELWELRSRMRHVEAVGERRTGTPSLLSEVEILRRRVVEMEGKDEELIRMGDQCRDLDQRLVRETSYCHTLKEEVDKLNGRINELDRIEEALGKSKQECSVLKNSLERERDVSKVLSTELDTLEVRVRELEAAESQLERREATIRQDMTKLRTLTVALVEDRKTMAEMLRQAEEKLSKQENKQNEQSNSATMTERLREERQQALTSTADLEERIMSIAKEKGELQVRLKTEEERNGDLQCKIAIMKKRLQVLERKEKEERRENDKQICSSLSNSTHHYQIEDNKVKELTQELDRLRRSLREKEVLEEELMKVEEAYKLLEGRFKDERKRYQALTEELETARRDLSKYHQAEKQEINQEHHLLCRLQQEQVKSRLLRREIEALKEKLQKLVGTEESICRVQVNHSTLQSKLTQQEARNRELAREMEELVSELDRYRQISKSLRPSANGQHFSDMKSTKEVQTEPADNLPSDYSTQTSLLHKRKLDEENDMDPNHNNEVINRSSSTPFSNLNCLNSANNNVSQYSSQSANGNDTHQTLNGEVMMLTHTPGQPLHIKVTPDHTLNTATLEISSPTGDAAASYTSTAVVPKSGVPPKQRITIIHNSALSSIKTKTSPSSPDGANSPINEMAIMRALSPNPSCSMASEHSKSPIQIVTVSSCSPEPTEVASQAAFCKTPDWQNRCHYPKSHSTNTSPSIITKEENKIHIHLGSSYIQSLDGVAHNSPQSAGPYYLQQEQRTQVVTNGCHVKGVGKITSSITITPATSPSSHPSNVTIPLGLPQKTGLTRIPKPKRCSVNRGTSRALKMAQNNRSPPTLHAGEKDLP